MAGSVVLNFAKYTNYVPRLYSRLTGSIGNLAPASTKIKNLPPLPPKRPVNPYQLFRKDQRTELEKNHKHLTFGEEAKFASEKWKALDSSAKEKYKDIFKSNMAKYEQATEKYWESLTNEQKKTLHIAALKKKQKPLERHMKKELQKLQMPIKPRTAYLFYVCSRLPNKDNISQTEYITKLGAEWKALSEHKKEEFKKKAVEDKERYSDEIKKWHEHMKKEGRQDILDYLDGHRSLTTEKSSDFSKSSFQRLNRGIKMLKSPIAESLPPLPKRPLYAFELFVKDERTELEKNNPNSTFAEMQQVISRKWSNLDPATKKFYEDLYKENTVKYMQDFDNYWKILNNEQKKLMSAEYRKEKTRLLNFFMQKELQDLKIPVKPLQAFFLYTKSRMPKKDGVSQKEFLKMVGSEWRNLSEESKMEFKRKADEDKERYNKEIKEWRASMEKEGHKDILAFFDDRKKLTGRFYGTEETLEEDKSIFKSKSVK